MQRPLGELLTRPPFSELFPIKPTDLAAIAGRMREHGFDPSKPIDIWGEHDVVVDGHTRLQAAAQAGLPAVEEYEHDFPDEDAALEYAISNQRDRRNLTDADILRCVAAVDQRRQGARSDLSPSGGKSGAAHTAALLGTSQRTVERARTVLDHAAPEAKEAVLAGDKSIHAAYQETQQARDAADRLLTDGDRADAAGASGPPNREEEAETASPLPSPLLDRFRAVINDLECIDPRALAAECRAHRPTAVQDVNALLRRGKRWNDRLLEAGGSDV
jgi:ParB-like chromosome segregation protein Spo0J